LKRIIISRTDNIGDVVLTIPMAGFIKSLLPDSTIIFLGKKYTKPVIDCCSNIDEFIDWNYLSSLSSKKRIKYFKQLKADAIIHVYPSYQISKLSKQAQIPYRIGTTRRLYHYLFLNKLIPLSRKKSDLHEAQLNLKLIEGLFNNEIKNLSCDEIFNYYGFTKIKELNNSFFEQLSPNLLNVIVHPKSKGSAREWGLDNFSILIQSLPPQKYKVFIAGTDDEAKEMEGFLNLFKNIAVNLTGKLSLEQYIALISKADCLIAASTGPLHIAAAAGIHALGLYAPMKPIYPKRWAPIGKNAHYLVKDIDCNKCRKSGVCECIRSISPEMVKNELDKYYDLKFLSKT